MNIRNYLKEHRKYFFIFVAFLAFIVVACGISECELGSISVLECILQTAIGVVVMYFAIRCSGFSIGNDCDDDEEWF